MSEKRKYESFQQENPIDLDSIIKDVLRQWWVILLLTLSAMFLAGAYKRLTYSPVYKTSTTFVVGKTGFSNNLAYDNLASAENVTTKFTQIVNSSVLQRRVCDELELPSYEAEVKIDVVESSNLMTLSLTAASPDLAYEMIQSVMNITMELSSEMMDAVTFKILQAPVMPQRPSNMLVISSAMKKAGLLMMALALIGFVLRSYFKDTIKNSEEAKKKLDARLLGTIYHEEKRKGAKDMFKKVKRGLNIEDPLVSFSYAESLKMAATRVHSAMERKNVRTILITSVSENEGKSTVAANLALALAQEEKKIALLDCDFCKPSQYKLFELGKVEEGDLVEYLSGKQPLGFHKVGETDNVRLFCSKTAKQHFLSYEIMEKLREMIATLLKEVDYVILDTSPMALVSDGEELATLVDSSLLVVQQDQMEAKYINDTIDQLNRTRAKVLGCVFNNVHKGFFSRNKTNGYYGSKYRYRSHYGKDGYDKKQEK